jgi:hypothetical protein
MRGPERTAHPTTNTPDNQHTRQPTHPDDGGTHELNSPVRARQPAPRARVASCRRKTRQHGDHHEARRWAAYTRDDAWRYARPRYVGLRCVNASSVGWRYRVRMNPAAVPSSCGTLALVDTSAGASLGHLPSGPQVGFRGGHQNKQTDAKRPPLASAEAVSKLLACRSFRERAMGLEPTIQLGKPADAKGVVA